MTDGSLQIALTSLTENSADPEALKAVPRERSEQNVATSIVHNAEIPESARQATNALSVLDSPMSDDVLLAAALEV